MSVITRDWLLSDSPASRAQAAWGRRYRLWLQFRRHGLAMIGLCVILFVILMSAFAPLLATQDPGAQDLALLAVE